MCIFNPWNNVYNGVETEKDLLKDRDIANFQGGKCTFAPIYLKISAMEGEIFWAFLILGTMSTMVSRPILKNPFTFAYKFYNIELGVANYTGVASHGWLTIR